MYMKVMQMKKETNTIVVSQDDFSKIQEEVWGRFENVREDIYIENCQESHAESLRYVRRDFKLINWW